MFLCNRLKIHMEKRFFDVRKNRVTFDSKKRRINQYDNDNYFNNRRYPGTGNWYLELSIWKWQKRRKGWRINMNPLIWLVVILGALLGLVSSLYIIVSLIGMIIYKIYRKCKYHVSLYD